MNERILLEGYGYTVIPAPKGEDAVRISKSDENIDLILMDIDLGAGMDGTEAAEMILEDRDIPILFLSSHADPGIVEKTEKITSYGYVVKSSDITVLHASIKMAFKLFDANRKLKSTKDMLEATLDAIPDIMFIIDDQGRLTDFHSDANSDSLAMPVERLIGSHLRDVFGEAEVAKQMELYRNCIESGEVQSNAFDLVIGGAKRTFDSRVAKLDSAHVLAIVRDVTERRRAEEEGREKKDRMDDLISSTVDWEWETNENDEYCYISGKGAKYLGYSREEILGRKPFDFMTAEEAKRIEPIMAEIKREKKAIKNLENWNIGKNGESYCFLSNGMPIFDAEGNLKGYRGVDRDITTIKSAESALARNEKKYRGIIEQSVNGIVLTDERGDIDIWNEAMEAITGLGRCEVVGSPLWEIRGKLVPKGPGAEEVSGKTRSAIERMLETRGDWKNEAGDADIVAADGTRRSVRASCFSVQQDKAVLVGVILNDVTDVRRAQKELSESESRLSRAEKVAGIGNWKYCLDEGQMVFSEGMRSIFGVEKERMTLEDVRGIDLPEYGPVLDRALEDLISRGIPYDVEFRIRRKNDGKILDLHSTADYDAENNIVYGVVRDVTQQKLSEMVLRESEQRYRVFLEKAPVALSVTRNRRGLFANGAFLDLFGISNPDDVMGISAEEYYAPRCREEMNELIRNHDFHGSSMPLCYETIGRRLDGSEFPERVVALEIQLADGPAIIGFVTDLTDLKLREQKIRTLLAEKELILHEVHHRIKNNMNTMMSLLSLQAHTTKNPAIVKPLRDAENRLRSMGVLYDRLYRSTDLLEMSAKEYLPALVAEIVRAFPNHSIVRTETHVGDFILSVKELSTLGMIVNELISNAMKYAFVGRTAGSIEVSASRAEGRTTIAIVDDGLGMPETIDVENSTGFGLMLVGNLTKQLEGRIRIERGKGTSFFLEF